MSIRCFVFQRFLDADLQPVFFGGEFFFLCFEFCLFLSFFLSPQCNDANACLIPGGVRTETLRSNKVFWGFLGVFYLFLFSVFGLVHLGAVGNERR